MKTIIKIILNILIIFMLIVLCFILISKYNNNFNIFGYTTFINTGTSMYPNIDINDLLIVKKEDNYYVNDIITYINDENIITTHRIIEIDNNTYITKGDSNNFIDGYHVKNNDIYGKVVYQISNFNKVIRYIICFMFGITILSLIIDKLIRK